MSTITLSDVKYVASLAKIAIQDDEAAKFTQELDVILGYFKELQNIDTTGLEPTYQISGLKNVMRKDTLHSQEVTREALLSNSPRQRDGCVEVPKVL